MWNKGENIKHIYEVMLKCIQPNLLGESFLGAEKILSPLIYIMFIKIKKKERSNTTVTSYVQN